MTYVVRGGRLQKKGAPVYGSISDAELAQIQSARPAGAKMLDKEEQKKKKRSGFLNGNPVWSAAKSDVRAKKAQLVRNTKGLRNMPTASR